MFAWFTNIGHGGSWQPGDFLLFLPYGLWKYFLFISYKALYLTTNVTSHLIFIHMKNSFSSVGFNLTTIHSKEYFYIMLVKIFIFKHLYLFVIKWFEHWDELTWFSEELGSSTAILPWFTSLNSELTRAPGILGDTAVTVQGFTWGQKHKENILGPVLYLPWPEFIWNLSFL